MTIKITFDRDALCKLAEKEARAQLVSQDVTVRADYDTLYNRVTVVLEQKEEVKEAVV